MALSQSALSSLIDAIRAGGGRDDQRASCGRASSSQRRNTDGGDRRS